MRIGITGERGFIGKSVKEALIKEGHKVISLDKHLGSSKKAVVTGKKRLDWILHFAAKTSIEDSFKNPLSTCEDNIMSTLSALRIARLSKAAFLYMSSYVYGKPKYMPIDEKHPVDPTNPYMASKLLGEIVCSRICPMLGIPLVILRGFNIYGYTDNSRYLIPNLIKSARSGRPLVINDPVPKRDYLYIKDFCSLINKIIARKKAAQGVYNVGYGRSNSNREVAELVAKLTERRTDIKIMFSPRRNEISDCVADRRLVSKVFLWKPLYSLEKGLAELLNQSKRGR